MKEFMFIFRGGQVDHLGLSPEAMQVHVKKWGDWMESLGKQEILLGGQPLLNEGLTYIENGTKLIDRPLAEGKDLIGGFILVKADDLRSASVIAKGCPGFSEGTTVEIREITQV